MIGGLVTDPINLLLGIQEAEEQKEATAEMMRQIQGLPSISFGPGYTPEMYQTPESAQYKLGEAPAEDRMRQMEALQKLQDLSEGHIASQGAYERQKALMDAANMAKGQTEAALANAQARGVGGSGLEFALRNQGGQAAANQAMQGGMQSAAQAALERMQANQAYQQGLGQVRGQDYQQAAQNADIINRFNMYNTQQRNGMNQGNVQLRNQAGQSNLARDDRNKVANNDVAFRRTGMQMQLLPSQKNDISGAYQPLHQFTTKFGEHMDDLEKYGMGGGSGGNIDPQMFMGMFGGGGG